MSANERIQNCWGCRYKWNFQLLVDPFPLTSISFTNILNKEPEKVSLTIQARGKGTATMGKE